MRVTSTTTTTTISVLSFNVCMGGASVDLAQVAAAIVASGADVVGLQEAGGNAPRIAALAGLAHVDERHQVLSRWPIAEPSGADSALVYVQPVPGRMIAVANVHLPAEHYGPYLLRDGVALAETLANERRVRLAALDRMWAAWERTTAAGIPLVVTGDFNAPAHSDWGAAWAEHRTVDVAWPVSSEMETAGFVDVYRAANPTSPGLTWTYGYPHPLGDGDEPRDRIDFVWCRAAADVIVDATVVGPAGVPDVGVAVDPWPSDHLGVLARLAVVPTEPPPFVAALASRVEIGGRVPVRFATPGSPDDRIVLVPAGADAADALMWLPPIEVQRFGQVDFGTGHLAPGPYDVVLASDGVELCRTRVTLVEPGAPPRLHAAFEGGALVVTWRAAPGRKFDWVGVYRVGDPDLYHGALAMAHTLATVDGSHEFRGLDGDAFTVRLLTDDSLMVLAEAHAHRT